MVFSAITRFDTFPRLRSEKQLTHLPVLSFRLNELNLVARCRMDLQLEIDSLAALRFEDHGHRCVANAASNNPCCGPRPVGLPVKSANGRDGTLVYDTLELIRQSELWQC